MNDQKSLPQDLDLTGSPQGVLAGALGDLYTYTAGPIDKHFVCISGGTELTAEWAEEVYVQEEWTSYYHKGPTPKPSYEELVSDNFRLSQMHSKLLDKYNKLAHKHFLLNYEFPGEAE
jgi:hypothetical protein